LRAPTAARPMLRASSGRAANLRSNCRFERPRIRIRKRSCPVSLILS